MDGHAFCREWLKTVMPDVRKQFTSAEIKAAWVYHLGYGNYEFHGPHDHYDHNLKMADCMWSAKAEGWQRLLEKAQGEK
jgi:hypothetical protein